MQEPLDTLGLESLSAVTQHAKGRKVLADSELAQIVRAQERGVVIKCIHEHLKARFEREGRQYFTAIASLYQAVRDYKLRAGGESVK